VCTRVCAVNVLQRGVSVTWRAVCTPLVTLVYGVRVF
jgi:hypothetical protein